MNMHVTDIHGLRALLVEKAAMAPGSMAPMFTRMIAVMDNFVPTKGSGRRYMPFEPKKVRQLQRQVSLTIDGIYGIRNTPHTLSGLLPKPGPAPFARGR